jgi:hypothetical protein
MICVLHPFCWRIAGHAGRKPWALIWKGKQLAGADSKGRVLTFYCKRWNLGDFSRGDQGFAIAPRIPVQWRPHAGSPPIL